MVTPVECIWSILQSEIFSKATPSDLFNQYKEIDKRYDRPEGATIRQQNLRNYLESIRNWKSIDMIIGEAAGKNGMRFSGVPFTSEIQLLSKNLPFTGEQSSLRELCGKRNGKPYYAYSANIFWKEMLPMYNQGYDFLAWDCILFHPHDKEDVRTNRSPTPKELKDNSEILRKVVEKVKPKKIITIGKKAEEALAFADIKVTPIVSVPHPASYGGGVRKFREGIARCSKI